MADVIDTPLRLFAELTTDGALAGRYQLEFQRRVEVDGKEIVPAAINVRDLTPEEGADVLASDAAGLAAKVQALSAQIAAEREEAKKTIASVTAERERIARDAAAAFAVVDAVRQADAGWTREVAGPMKALETQRAPVSN